MLEQFKERFVEFKDHEFKLDLFSTPLHFDTEKATTPALQMELIEIQQIQDLKVKFLENDFPVFHRKYFPKEKFPELRMFAVRQMALFGSTYTVEQLFSRMRIIKSKYRSVLNDQNLETSLRLASTSIETDIHRIMKSWASEQQSLALEFKT